MELLIDLDKIKDTSKREWLINSLKLMKIGFETSERPQTIEEYNRDLELGKAAGDRGEYTDVMDLMEEVKKW